MFLQKCNTIGFILFLRILLWTRFWDCYSRVKAIYTNNPNFENADTRTVHWKDSSISNAKIKILYQFIKYFAREKNTLNKPSPWHYHMKSSWCKTYLSNSLFSNMGIAANLRDSFCCALLWIVAAASPLPFKITLLRMIYILSIGVYL